VKKIKIGLEEYEDAAGSWKVGKHAIAIDLATLKQTRLLITADSGGGKTFLIKKIIEESFGKLPIHVIDPEGEFAPLRELFDFFLIAKGGDTPPVVGLARAQAQKFLEIRASVICDIYDLPPARRHDWVKEYLEGLTEAPKAMRHPCLVIVDEAHLFAPETGKSVAADAMADIASRGRKRGLILIVATQRLAKMNKDVTSEMLNRLIGPTFEDVNRDRAAQVLGILKADRENFFQQIRLLEPGHFFALGRAISKDLIRVKVGAIRSKHGDAAEKYNTTPPPPRGKIAAMLKNLTELPAEELRKAETVKELRQTIAKLRDDVTIYKREAQKIMIPTIDRKKTKAAIKAAQTEARREYVESVRAMRIDFAKQILRTRGLIRTLIETAKRGTVDLRNVADRMEMVLAHGATTIDLPIPAKITKIEKAAAKLPIVTMNGAEIPATVTRSGIVEVGAKVIPVKTAAAPAAGDVKHVSGPAVSNGKQTKVVDGAINSSQKRILEAIARMNAIGIAAPSRAQIAVWSQSTLNSSTFANNISDLKTRGLVTYPGHWLVSLTAQGVEEAPRGSRSLTGKEVFDQALGLLNSSQQEQLRTIRDVWPESISKETIANSTGQTLNSSTFANNISGMKTMGLIEYPAKATCKLASWLGDLGVN
jgi:hypothetical protein